MTQPNIKVVRNEAGNCINFVGTTNPAYWNACLSAEVDTEDATRINVINNVRTVQQGEKVYEFFKIPHTKFQDADGNGFANATECAAYITANCNVAGNTGTFEFGLADLLDIEYNSTQSGLLFSTGDSFVVGGVRAVANDAGFIDIRQHSGDKILYRNVIHTNVRLAGVQQSGTITQVVDAINAFVLGEVSLFSAPDLSSLPSTVDVIAGAYFSWPLNIDPSAPVATEFSYVGLPDTLFASSNYRGILQGQLSAGSYPVTIRGFNSFGYDEKIVTFVSAAPGPFDNINSVTFEPGYWAETDITDGPLMNGVLGGLTPWSVGFYFRPSRNGNNWQNIVVFGQSADNQSRVNIAFNGANDKIILRIGEASDNYIQLTSPGDSVIAGSWHHVFVTYDGAGTASSDWKVYIDGALQTMTQDDLQGTPTLPTVDQLRVGRCLNNEDPLRDGVVDELAIWSSDQSASVTAIYNSGTPFDLNSLGTPPVHWWGMGDGDTFPTLGDFVGGVNLTLQNATAAAIIAAVP